MGHRNRFYKKRMNKWHGGEKERRRYPFHGNHSFAQNNFSSSVYDHHNVEPSMHNGTTKNLVADLRAKGFSIHSIVPDGNCLFRSCADQLFGDQNRHKEVRRNAVRYMITHKDDFVPFMDKDREPFDMYIRRMMNNCTWGGDLEINAISNCYKCNVIVYQDRRPNIELQTFPDRDRVMRLAYFGSCHYESVRGHNYKSLSAESLPGTVVLRPDSVKRKEVEGEGRNMMVGEGRNVIAGEGKKALTNHGKKELPSERRIESTVIRRIVPVTDGKESAAGTKQIATDKKEESLKQKSSIAVMETSKESISQLSKPFRPLSKEEIAERNEHIIRHMEKRFNKKQKHHHHREGEWCGDLPFDQLVTPEMQERLKLVPRKNQLLKTLRFLTMKCGCHSGSYFKYCCFPKMKACINRNRYHLSKFRV